MNKIKELLRNQSTKKTIIILITGIIVLVFIIILIVFIIRSLTYKMSYQELENQLINATEKYLKEEPQMNPTIDNPTIIITPETLLNGKYLKKEINKMVKDTCTAEISVNYQNGYNYIKPLLSCQNYETKLLFDKILIDNPVENKINGLYDLNEMLIFKGDQPKNYVKFHNLLWRVVKMDPTDKTIYLILNNLKDTTQNIWDNRYNTYEESRHGINDFSVSVILNELDKIYNEKFNDTDRKYMLPMNICIGKRSNIEERNDGSVECFNTMNEQKYLSLLPLYDYINISTDYQCKSANSKACSNYNYLVDKSGKWWTLTADGAKGTNVYAINYNGDISSDFADTKKYIRYTIAIDGNALYKEGTGDLNSPYQLK